MDKVTRTTNGDNKKGFVDPNDFRPDPLDGRSSDLDHLGAVSDKLETTEVIGGYGQ